MSIKTLTLNNSPIEFVLIGPYQGSDKILLRSYNAKLDLIGFAFEKALGLKLPPPSPLSSFFTSLDRQLNIVQSKQFYDIEPSIDNRSSSFRFVWAGYCSQYNLNKIEETLNHSIFRVGKAIIDEDIHEIELKLSSVLFHCDIANRRYLQRRQFARFALIIYILFVLIGLIYLTIFIGNTR